MKMFQIKTFNSVNQLLRRNKIIRGRSYLKETRGYVLANTFTNSSVPLLPPPPLPDLQSLPLLLECHYSVGGFNVAFNPHCFIITLTFTLNSIKFLTADLLQWLFFVLQRGALIVRFTRNYTLHRFIPLIFSIHCFNAWKESRVSCFKIEWHKKGQKYY